MTGKLTARTWNRGEEPVDFVWDGTFKFDDVIEGVRVLLETKDFAKIVDAENKVILYYRAFTDPYRGRLTACGMSVPECNVRFRQLKAEAAKKVFTPRELYDLKPADVSYYLDYLLNPHLPEVYDAMDFNYKEAEQMQRIEIRVLADQIVSGDRVWTLATIWFDGDPVMVVNSGEDRHDHRRWITNKFLFEEMVKWLRSFLPTVIEEDFVDEDTIIPAMTEFNNSTLHRFYDAEKQEAVNA
jgi:hypothetical protein